MGVACCEVCDIYFATHLRKNVFALAIKVRAYLFLVHAESLYFIGIEI